MRASWISAQLGQNWSINDLQWKDVEMCDCPIKTTQVHCISTSRAPVPVYQNSMYRGWSGPPPDELTVKIYRLSWILWHQSRTDAQAVVFVPWAKPSPNCVLAPWTVHRTLCQSKGERRVMTGWPISLCVWAPCGIADICQGNSPWLISLYISYSLFPPLYSLFPLSPSSLPFLYITSSISSYCDCYGHSHVM
jgi:hypothetical protein